MRHNFQGAITALVTPFTSKNKVDVEALRKLVDFQLENGIDGLVPCGSTGEASTLSEAEYRLVIETVVSEARGRVPVIAGAGTNNTQHAIHLAQIAEKAGADALLHVTPYYNKPTPNGLIAHFAAIAEAVDLPVIAYNIPGRTGSNMSVATLLRLIKEVPQVIGVKEASGDIVQQMNIISEAPPEFIVLAGDDAFTLPVMAIGGKGVISATANEIPGPFAELVHAAQAGDWAKARELHYKWLDLVQTNFIETNPIPIKTALAMMGKITEALRLPLTSMEPQNRQVLEKVLRGHKLV